MVVVFLFHRDLRLYDNLPLQKALDFKDGKDTDVLPLFIFTPEQVGNKAPIRSLKSIACMIECLNEVNEEQQNIDNIFGNIYNITITNFNNLYKINNSLQSYQTLNMLIKRFYK